MLEARAWLFVEPVVPMEFSKNVRYITDLSPDVTTCPMPDLMKALRIEFQIPRKETDNMEDHLKSGMSVIVDLVKKIFGRHDKEDSALIRKGTIRTAAKKVNQFDRAIKSKAIENIVNKTLRKQ